MPVSVLSPFRSIRTTPAVKHHKPNEPNIGVVLCLCHLQLGLTCLDEDHHHRYHHQDQYQDTRTLTRNSVPLKHCPLTCQSLEHLTSLVNVLDETLNCYDWRSSSPPNSIQSNSPPAPAPAPPVLELPLTVPTST